MDTILIAAMKRQAETGIFDGTNEITQYFLSCKGHDFKTGTILIFTRDTGMHSSGWWKNPEYERCYHLSMSFRHILTGEYMPFNTKIAFTYVKAFFGDDYKKTWCEPPHSDDGKIADCWHYRLFCDENWQPIQPRGEVYSKTLTEAGFKTFSEVREEKRKETANNAERNQV